MSDQTSMDDAAYLELIEARYTTKDQVPIRRIVSLKPSLYAEREAAAETFRAAHAASSGEDRKVKMNGSPLQKARAALDAIDDEIRRTSIVVTLKPKDAEAMALFTAPFYQDDTPVVVMWKKVLVACFSGASKVGEPDAFKGAPLPGITAKHYAKVVESLPLGEVRDTFVELEKAQQAPDFPQPAAR